MSRLQKAFCAGLAASGMWLGVSAATAPAAPILSQDFNDSAVFSTTTALSQTGVGDVNTADGLWRARDSGGTHPIAGQAPGKAAGDLAMHLTRSTDPNNSNNTNGIGNPLIGTRDRADGITGGKFTFQYSLYRDSDASNFVVTVQQDDRLSSVPLSLALFFRADGSIGAINTAGDSYENTAAGKNTVSAQTWTTIRGEVDVDAGTWSAYATVGSNSELPLFTGKAFTGLQTVNAIIFIPQPKPVNTFWIDDVSISPVPEPASIGLLALGASALTLRRRRRCDA